ncbi:MAG: glycosyltransferase family 4 protein [Planctomycetota bacterium]
MSYAPPELALLVEGFDPARGGAERAVRALAEALAREGVPTAVYAPAERAGPDLPAPARRVAVELPRLPRPLWAWAAARRLGAAARRDGARRVVACGKLLGADAYWPHGGVHAATLASEARPGARLARALRPADWSYRRIEARALAECRAGRARALALSERVARDLRAHHGVEVAVLRNGVDPARFQAPDAAARGEARRALARRVGARGDVALALFCAHSFRLKGLETLLRAAGHQGGVHVVVVGGDAPGPWLALAQGLGLAGRLSFLGRVPDLAPLYRGATFLVHPSRYDPCSLVVLEALASGLPVIGSAADGASELIGAAGRVLTDPACVEALEDALGELSEPAARRVAAEAAAAFRRPWSAVGRELLELLG